MSTSTRLICCLKGQKDEFVALIHLAEGLCLRTLLTLKAKIFYFVLSTHINSDHSGLATYFALGNINKT
jgi:hypothetical protein